MRRRLGLVSLGLLISCLVAVAQFNQPVPTVHLKVRVFLSNGGKIQEQVRVELLNASENRLDETFTNTEGETDFPRVRPGNYRLKVTGPNIADTVTPVFTLAFNEGSHFENVSVNPRFQAKEKEEEEPATPGGVVSAAELNIPDKARKEFDKGTQALDHNDYLEAGKHFQKAVELYPRYAAAYNDLGIVAMKMGDRKAARAAFEQAVRNDDHDPKACLNLAKMLLQERQYPEVEKLLNQVLAVEPLNPETLTMLAGVQYQTGRYDQAINTAWKAHSVPHDNFAVVHIIAAMAFEHRHMAEEAAVEYTTYLKESPNGPEAAHARSALVTLQSQGP